MASASRKNERQSVRFRPERNWAKEFRHGGAAQGGCDDGFMISNDGRIASAGLVQ